MASCWARLAHSHCARPQSMDPLSEPDLPRGPQASTCSTGNRASISSFRGVGCKRLVRSVGRVGAFCWRWCKRLVQLRITESGCWSMLAA
eukprot:997304-Prymnesium_polylepis.1